jgi:gluconokinase
MKYIIGVDIGTSGTKAIALSHEGEVLASAYRPYEPLETLPDYHELSPAVLLDAFYGVVAELLSSFAGKADLTALSCSSAMHSLMVVDADDQPISALITWADLRSREEAARLKQSAAGNDIYRLSGTPIHPMTPLCKILWIKENDPQLYASASRFISIKEFILHKLTGKYQVDYSIASATGLFDIYRFDWNAEALKLAGISRDQLGEPVPTTHVVEVDLMLRPQLRLTTKVVIGASDGCLANLGSNAVRPGDVSLTIGTSGAVRMVTSKPSYDPKARIFNYILTEHLFVSGGPINNGGVLLKWYGENFLHHKSEAGDDFDAFVNTAAAVKAGSEGLVFLPYIQGERAPVWNADAKGVFFGITSLHTQAHFMRAIIEGICFSLRDVSLSLEETLGSINQVFASGGFVKSPAWVQILSDILGKSIQITDTADASSIGAAMLGLYALGIIPDLVNTTKFLSVQKTYDPSPADTAVYARNFKIYQGLYEKLKDDFSVPV